MRRRALSAAVAFSFVTTQLYALDFERTVREAARQASTQRQQAPASDENPYLWPGIALIGGGATLVMIGLTRTRGGEITVGTMRIPAPKLRTGLVVVGFGIAGAGGFALWAGEKKRKSPSITLGPGVLRVEKTISW